MRKNVVMMKIVVVAIVIFALTSVALSVGVGQEGTIKWQWETDSNASICGTPAIGPDGNIYVTAGVGGMAYPWVPERLFCISPQGSMLWKSQELDHCATSDPVIASDGTIYVVGYYKLYAFNPDGTLKWEWEPEPDLHYQIGGLALGTDGTIYTGHPGSGGGCVFAINPDGTLKWAEQYEEMGVFVAFTIGKNGDVYMHAWRRHYNDNVICALNPDNGAVLWSTELGSYDNQGGMAVGSDGTIYVPLYGTKKLQAFNPDGTKKWHYEFPGASGIPSIGSDGTIYAATVSNKGLYALTSSGQLKWTAGQCMGPDVAIASDGTIYFCGSDPETRRITGHDRDNYIAVNPDGSIKWTLEIPAHAGSPAIGSDGTIYVTGWSRPGVLTAVYGSAPLASSSWPRSRHDNRNTGSYGVIPTPTLTPTPTPTPDGEQQRLYPVADGRVYAYSYRNWNWANMGMESAMFAGWHPVGGESRAYLRFDLPAGLDISRAVLKLYQYHSVGPVHSLGVYRVTSSWEEGNDTYHSGKVEETAAPGELCWMQQPSFDPVPVATFTSATAVPAWVEVDITSLVQQWQAGTPNYGLVVKTTNEHPTASDPAAWSWYCTKEYPEPDQANRPVLELSSGTAPPPTPTPTPPKECEGDEPYLYVEDRVMGKGKTVEIPIMMCNAEDLANMDLDWSYNAAVLKIINVTKGSLNEKALFDWNEVSQGKLKIAFASSEGVTGSDSIAVMKFEVIGNTGDTSTLTGTVTTASKTDGTEISVSVNPGEFTVGTAPVKGALKISDLRGTLNTDNDCNLYVADYGDNQVKMINPNGIVTTYASGIDRPRYQVFDSAGNLYVGSFDGNIYNVSASGGKTTVASGIWSPGGMGFDGAGNLYVAGSYDGKIHRIAPDGSKTTMDSGFAHPKHLAVYYDGTMYVVANQGTLIVRITPEGGKANLVDLGETISGMATDGEYLYVSHSDKISRIDTSGQVTQIATDLDQPSSLTVCNGSVFVTVSDGIVKLKISDETKTGTCDWTGAWETDWDRMELQQNGNNVNGTYTHDQGRIQGTVSGRKLTGTWSEYPSYSPPGDAGDIVFIISEDCSSFDGKWRYGTSGGWSGSWTGVRKSTVSGTSYPEATLTHSGFDFSEGTTGESPIRDGEIIYWQPGYAGTHPDYPDYSGYLWWRNTHLDDVNYASQTKDMGAVDIATVRAVPAEWDKSPLIPPLLMGHTIVAKCYDGYVKFQVISVDTANESARVKYLYSTDTTFDEGTPTPTPTITPTVTPTSTL